MNEVARSRMFGKWFAVVVTAALTLTLVAGCGSGSSQPGSQPANAAPGASPVTIEAWFTPFYPEAELKKLGDDFNASHPNIHVNVTVVPWSNGREKIKTALTSGQGPDVFFIPTGLDQDYIDQGILAPVTSVGFTSQDVAMYTPLLRLNEVNGQVLALPTDHRVYVLYYRKDILSKYGFDHPPATWDELYTMAKKITTQSAVNGKPGVMGFQFDGADGHLNAINYTWMSLMGAAGGHYMSSGKSAEYSPANVAALSYMKKFYDEKISVGGLDSVNGFVAGKIAMFAFTQGLSDQNNWDKVPALKGNWGMAPMPTGPVSAAGYLGGNSIAVNARSKHLQEAGAFLKWFVSPEHSLLPLTYNHGIPPFDLSKIDPKVRDQIQAKMAEDKEGWDAVNKQLDNVLKGGSIDLVQEWRVAFTTRWNAEQSELIAAITGQTPVADALQQIDTRVGQDLHK